MHFDGVLRQRFRQGAWSGSGDDARRGAFLRFGCALLFAGAWLVLSVWLSLPWLSDLADLSHWSVALFVLTFIAYAPGFMNAFLLTSLVLRPGSGRAPPASWPGISVLIAAYQEESLIASTVLSLVRQDYRGRLEIIVVDDGSTDRTSKAARGCSPVFEDLADRTLLVERCVRNQGKSHALNRGLTLASQPLVVTLDADTLVEADCFTSLVEHLAGAGARTVAIAGAVFTANSGANWVTAMQQWDYFHGIAAIKRMQAMYGGTLVAQGALSLFVREVLVEAGGWPHTVGEDIVLTWGLLQQGYRVGYAEDAIAWTFAPQSLGALARQRKRWARGMIEALALHPGMLVQWRLRTMFIWWNLLFISIDLAFTCAFMPGLILAACGVFWLAGPLTLLVLPLAALWNLLIYRIQMRMLARANVRMERSLAGFVLYAGLYPFLMQPAAVWGYFAEFAGRQKSWGSR